MMLHAGLGGIVLCGGHSSRMNYPKAWLPFGAERMLQRVVRILGELTEPVVVVAAVGQPLPWLSSNVIVVRDTLDSLGPLHGLAVGLRTLANLPNGRCPRALVAPCDAPLVQLQLLAHLAAQGESSEIVVPRFEGRFQPLTAIYSVELWSRAEALLSADRRRVVELIEMSHTRVIEAAELAPFDPRFESFQNVNTPEQYFASVAAAGLKTPPWITSRLQLRPTVD